MIPVLRAAAVAAVLLAPIAAFADDAPKAAQPFLLGFHKKLVLNDSDRALTLGAEQALIGMMAGQSLQWGNGASGNAAGYAVVREGVDPAGNPCKEVRLDFQSGENRKQFADVICKVNGVWTSK